MSIFSKKLKFENNEKKTMHQKCRKMNNDYNRTLGLLINEKTVWNVISIYMCFFFSIFLFRLHLLTAQKKKKNFFLHICKTSTQYPHLGFLFVPYRTWFYKEFRGPTWFLTMPCWALICGVFKTECKLFGGPVLIN